ncbi:hypothetical protein BAME_30290 [Bacillus sp. M 2-6]|nr:hypothetical protein BAME_30290 [Bacillus sp. M 2-6]KIL27157.1 hypothetical protein B4133_3160 [Bacillus altitudinis]
MIEEKMHRLFYDQKKMVKFSRFFDENKEIYQNKDFKT